MSSWLNRSLVALPANGTATLTCTFTPATVGSLLVMVINSGSSFAPPAGWTPASGGSASGYSVLTVFTKTATAGESSASIALGTSNYAATVVVYEFAAGSTFGSAIASSGGSATSASPSLAVSGTKTVIAAIAGMASAGRTTSWSGATKDVDTTFAAFTQTITLSTAFVDGYATSTFAPTGTYSAGVDSKEAVSFSVAAVIPADTTPPSVPTGVTVTSITTSSAGVSWAASTDNNFVAGYEITIDGGATVRSVTSSPATLTGLGASTTYAVQIRAVDGAGNRSSYTSGTSFTTADPGGGGGGGGSTGPTSTLYVDAGYGTGTQNWVPLGSIFGAANTKAQRAFEAVAIKPPVQVVSGVATVTVTNSATSGLGTHATLANSSSLIAANIRMSQCGAGTPVAYGSAFFPPLARSQVGYDVLGSATWDFGIVSSAFEIHLKTITNSFQSSWATGGFIKVYVDGHLVLDWSQQTASGDFMVKVTLPASRPAHVRVDTSMGWVELNAGTTDRIWKPKETLFGRRLAVLSDSFGAAGRDPSQKGFVHWLSEYLGWEVMRCANSSTGYVATYSSGGGPLTKAFPDRIATDVAPLAPDLVLVLGSINDSSYSDSAIQTAASTTLTNLETALPGVPVILAGPQFGYGTDGRLTTQQAAIQAGAAGHFNVLGSVISMSGWFTSSDPLGDGTHPTTIGHQYLAWRLAGEIEQRIKAVLV